MKTETNKQTKNKGRNKEQREERETMHKDEKGKNET